MLLPSGVLTFGSRLAASISLRWMPPIVGLAEGTEVIFVAACSHGHTDIYEVQLNSGRTTKVSEGYGTVFPYTSFCIPAMDTPCSKSSLPNKEVKDREKVVEVHHKLKQLVRRFPNKAGRVSRRLHSCMSSLRR
uniref:Uncharacterized protein n=1 Tax=Arundo donax TaxID=35708 RepID=A0A0A9GRL6_ARUDO